MITAEDVKHLVAGWKLFWGRNLVDNADGVDILIKDCQRLTDSGVKLRQFLQDFRRLHMDDTPSWNQFAAFVRKPKPMPAQIDSNDGVPDLDIGDARVGEYLAAIRAEVGGVVKRVRSPESDRYTPRRERERLPIVDNAKALQARQALLMGGDEHDVPDGEIPF